MSCCLMCGNPHNREWSDAYDFLYIYREPKPIKKPPQGWLLGIHDKLMFLTKNFPKNLMQSIINKRMTMVVTFTKIGKVFMVSR